MNTFETTRQRNYGSGAKGFTWRTTLVGSVDVIGTGKTKDEAETEAARLLKALVENVHRTRYFTSPSGKTLFVARFTWSWGYEIVRNGQSRGSCSTGDTFEQCCDAAAAHAASYYEEMD